MDWYYAEDQEKRGPFNDQAFKRLVEDGTISPDTFVWNNTMKDWQKFSTTDYPGESAGQNRNRQTNTLTCTECGQSFSEDELVSYNESLVCASCKPAFLQKIREGVSTGGAMTFAGFWIRLGAKAIDWIIVTLVIYAVMIPFDMLFMPELDMAAAPNPEDMKAFVIPSIMMSVFQFGIYIFYTTWFVGKYAATPGKMVCGLKIVTAENQRVSYLRAFARYFAEMLSSIILFIGYIMAAFSSEKKALHDRICSTRVIKR